MNLLRPLFAARSGLTSLGLASIGLACSACGAAPPPVEAPTVHLVPEPPLEPFVCGAMAHGPMGPGGPRFADGGPRFADGPRHGPHGRRGPRGEQGWHPGPGAPPPPWAAGLGPGATEPGTQPPPPLAAPPRAGARGAPRTEPLPLEIVRTHAEGEPTGWSTELRLHSTGAPLGAVLTELARTAIAAIVVDPELAPRPVVAHVEAASAEAIASQLA
ncbi:MAG: hypothetical protein K1X94_27335, partial [Sandaracinaceae bacterium]|nr:hypothetical protein [Sandaracinaceae bacterium]